MSGTSLDGLDIALCQVNGSGPETALRVLHFRTVSYPAHFRKRLKTIFAQRTIQQPDLCLLHAMIGRMHGTFVNDALREWGVANHQVDLVASHGQTVFHAPQPPDNSSSPNSTLQIGDGDHVAVTTGIITVSDFRQKHVAAGGEGAPLAVYGDYLLFGSETESRILLNIGGIANFTYLPAAQTGNRAFASDTGPGNTLMDQYMQQHLGLDMDRDARTALSGNVHSDLLQALRQDAFFDLGFPKTTGPEQFNLDYVYHAQRVSATTALGHPDVMATLCAFTATTIADAIGKAVGNDAPIQLYLSGGGLHNPMLKRLIQQQLGDIPVTPFDRLGLPSDAKEAALFALLANETVAGNAANIRAIGYAPTVCMGKISFPK